MDWTAKRKNKSFSVAARFSRDLALEFLFFRNVFTWCRTDRLEQVS